jgi:hypothetical protein
VVVGDRLWTFRFLRLTGLGRSQQTHCVITFICAVAAVVAGAGGVAQMARLGQAAAAVAELVL